QNTKNEISVLSNAIKSIPRFNKLIATIMHYPISLSYAMTISKSQSMTLDNVVLSLAYIPSPSLVTVAVSRCRTAKGVYINGDFRKPNGEIDPLILEFL